MHPLNNGSQVENVPALKPRVGTPGYFSESNDNGAPSYPGQDWFNAVIREFQNALSASGVTFDPDRFDHLKQMITNASNGARNLLEANQNFNVPGNTGHPLPSSSAYTYPAGAEIAKGFFVVGGTLDNVTYNIFQSGYVLQANPTSTGKLRAYYDKDPQGILKESNVYGSVVGVDEVQRYAGDTPGIAVGIDGNKLYVEIDFSLYRQAVKIIGLAQSKGRLISISNKDSRRGSLIPLALNPTGWNSGDSINWAPLNLNATDFELIYIEFAIQTSEATTYTHGALVKSSLAVSKGRIRLIQDSGVRDVALTSFTETSCIASIVTNGSIMGIYGVS